MKNVLFIFTNNCLATFNCLKEQLINTLIAITPNWNQPFELMCDASDEAIKTILGQQKEERF